MFPTPPQDNHIFSLVVNLAINTHKTNIICLQNKFELHFLWKCMCCATWSFHSICLEHLFMTEYIGLFFKWLSCILFYVYPIFGIILLYLFLSICVSLECSLSKGWGRTKVMNIQISIDFTKLLSKKIVKISVYKY